MSISETFEARILPQILQADHHYIATPKSFDYLGAVGESADQFDDWCSAIRLVGETVQDNPELAEAIAVLMNRAAAYGSQAARQPA